MGFVFGSLRTRLLLYSTTTRRDITLIQRALCSIQAAHKTPITIDVVSDPRCPWCVVAHHRLRKAIDEAALAIPVRVRFSPYFLDDTLPIEGIDRRKYYIQRFGDEAMAKVNQQMKEVFRQEGIGHEYVSTVWRVARFLRTDSWHTQSTNFQMIQAQQSALLQNSFGVIFRLLRLTALRPVKI